MACTKEVRARKTIAQTWRRSNIILRNNGVFAPGKAVQLDFPQAHRKRQQHQDQEESEPRQENLNILAYSLCAGHIIDDSSDDDSDEEVEQPKKKQKTDKGSVVTSDGMPLLLSVCRLGLPVIGNLTNKEKQKVDECRKLTKWMKYFPKAGETCAICLEAYPEAGKPIFVAGVDGVDEENSTTNTDSNKSGKKRKRGNDEEEVKNTKKKARTKSEPKDQKEEEKKVKGRKKKAAEEESEEEEKPRKKGRVSSKDLKKMKKEKKPKKEKKIGSSESEVEAKSEEENRTAEDTTYGAKDAVMLPCLHNFCKSCLIGW